MGRPKKKKEMRGGRREGAGRKPGFSTMENPRNENITFRVSKKTLAQIRALREATRDDETTFNEMFTQWVDETARDYGLDQSADM